MNLIDKNEVTILIAEDVEGHAMLIEENLKTAGVSNKIMHFYNGEEVYDFFKKNIIDSAPREDCSYLLLLDIKMPKMDGFELLKFMKSHPKLKTMPVIMLTTTDDPHEIHKCYELGCNAYITKPVEIKSFIDTLKRLGLFILIIKVTDVNQA